MKKIAYLLPLLAVAATEPAKTDPARLSAMTKELSSDAFGGRAPGTDGEKKTIEWAIARFKALGLQPGGPDGSWTQKVPLIHTRLADGPVSFGATQLKQGTDVALTTVRADPAVAIDNAPLVFVGYGVTVQFSPTGETTVDDLVAGTIQVANVYTADPRIQTDDLVTLTDPKGLFLASNVVPVVNSNVAGDVADVLNKVSAALTPEGLVELNVKSTVDQESSADIAKEWLAANGF